MSVHFGLLVTAPATHQMKDPRSPYWEESIGIAKANRGNPLDTFIVYERRFRPHPKTGQVADRMTVTNVISGEKAVVDVEKIPMQGGDRFIGKLQLREQQEINFQVPITNGRQKIVEIQDCPPRVKNYVSDALELWRRTR